MDIQERALALVEAEPGIKTTTLYERLGIRRMREGRACEVKTTVRWMIYAGLLCITYDRSLKVIT